MNQLTTINNMQLEAKEYKGQRVVTFKYIDLVHKRVSGIAEEMEIIVQRSLFDRKENDNG